MEANARRVRGMPSGRDVSQIHRIDLDNGRCPDHLGQQLRDGTIARTQIQDACGTRDGGADSPPEIRDDATVIAAKAGGTGMEDARTPIRRPGALAILFDERKRCVHQRSPGTPKKQAPISGGLIHLLDSL